MAREITPYRPTERVTDERPYTGEPALGWGVRAGKIKRSFDGQSSFFDYMGGYGEEIY
jgi:hypothetical protein